MGTNFAHDLANEDFGLSLEQQLSIHLASNHYPPVPLALVPVCMRAILLANSEGWFETIRLPKGVSYRGEKDVPVWVVIENFHLHEWIDDQPE